MPTKSEGTSNNAEWAVEEGYVGEFVRRGLKTGALVGTAIGGLYGSWSLPGDDRLLNGAVMGGPISSLINSHPAVTYSGLALVT